MVRIHPLLKDSTATVRFVDHNVVVPTDYCGEDSPVKPLCQLHILSHAQVSQKYGVDIPPGKLPLDAVGSKSTSS